MIKSSARRHAASGNGNNAGRVYADWPKGLYHVEWLLEHGESIPETGWWRKGYGYLRSWDRIFFLQNNLLHSRDILPGSRFPRNIKSYERFAICQ